MNALNLLVDEVKGYSFKGSVNIDDLDNSILDKLGIDRDTSMSDEIEVEGEFQMSKSQDESYVSNIEYVNLIGLNGRHVELTDDQYDIADLSAQIETNGAESQYEADEFLEFD